MHFNPRTVRFKLNGQYHDERDQVLLRKSSIEVVLMSTEKSSAIPDLNVVSVRRTVTQEELDHSQWRFEPIKQRCEPGKGRFVYRLVFDGEIFTQELGTCWSATFHPLYQAIVYEGRVEITTTNENGRATHLYANLTYGPA